MIELIGAAQRMGGSEGGIGEDQSFFFSQLLGVDELIPRTVSRAP